MDELKPPPMSEAQILAIFQPWSDTAGTSHADLMELTVAARDQQWLALVGELQRDAAEREREACAKVCEQSDKDGEGPDCWGWHSKDYAAAIRSREKVAS